MQADGWECVSKQLCPPILVILRSSSSSSSRLLILLPVVGIVVAIVVLVPPPPIRKGKADPTGIEVGRVLVLRVVVVLIV